MNLITWIEINRSLLEHNLIQYQNWLGNMSKIAPVIKANAYGHGLYEIASICDNNPIVQRLCVTNSQEAIHLRTLGIKKPILILGYINSELKETIKQNIDITVYSMNMIDALQKTAAELQLTVNIQLKVDTGLSRLGIFPHEVTEYIQKIKQLPNLNLQGIWSQIANDLNTSSIYTQEELFASINKSIQESHIAKSQAALYTKYKYNYARIGIGIYGYLPSAHPLRDILKPVLSLKSRIIHIKTVLAGSSIGYLQIKTNRTKTIAILGIGYYDGISPELIHGGKVIIHGKHAPILSINMNMTIIDISHIIECKIHDIATFLGNESDQTISLYDWQNIINTKNIRELLTRLECSIPRIITTKQSIIMQNI